MLSLFQDRVGRYGLAFVTLIAGLAVGLGASAFAHHNGSTTTIHACVATKDGAVRILSPGGTCDEKKETPIQWNVQGPQGPPGPQGAKGDPGPTGPAGTSAGVGLVVCPYPACNWGDLSGKDMFVGKDLRPVIVANAYLNSWNLMGANLSGGDLRDTGFGGGILDDADFSGADLTAARLVVDSAQRANFTGTTLTRARIEKFGYLNETPLSTMLSEASFEGATMRGVRIRGIALEGANFTNADLSPDGDQKSLFYYVSLAGADFTDANLTGLVFLGWYDSYEGRWNTTVETTGAIWSNTICPDGTNSDSNGDTCEGHFIVDNYS